MIETVRLEKVRFDTEPEIPVVGGPLCRGYEEYIAGDRELGRQLIAEFYAAVYGNESRREERSMEHFVREIYNQKGMAIPERKADADQDVLLAAAMKRFDHYQRPLVESILKDGYLPYIGSPVTMHRQNGFYFVGDGKNRCSILAALGAEEIEHVRVMG